jgi:CheY-like chemotaxis protein
MMKTADGKTEVALKSKKVLKILWVEDLEDDIMFAERQLKKGGIQFVTRGVMTRQEFTVAISEFHPDVILSDQNLPQFNCSEAFKIYKEHHLNIPFILVTGMVSEDVSSLNLGVDDYVLKSDLSRLSSAILNAIREREIERCKIEKSR